MADTNTPDVETTAEPTVPTVEPAPEVHAPTTAPTDAVWPVIPPVPVHGYQQATGAFIE